MPRFFHLLTGLTVGVVSIGCGLQSGENASQNDPLSIRKREVTQERVQVIQSHHERTVEEFVKTEGMGVSRILVIAHRATPMSSALTLPGWAEEPALDATGSVPAATLLPWFQEKVELVGLLMKEKPGVYPLKREGGKIERKKTRDLDDFETAALQKLRDGEELQVADSPDNIRVLGAIRMRKECRSCHDKPEGTLLGAFSYVMKPGLPKAAPAPVLPPLEMRKAGDADPRKALP